MLKKIDLLADYKEFLNSPLKENFVADNTAIPDNSIAWNSNYQALRINDASTTIKGALSIQIGKVSVGDVITVEAEIMNISGTKAKFALDIYNNYGAATHIATDGIVTSKKEKEFELVRATFVVANAGYGMLVLGTYTPDMGDFYIRNVRFKKDTDYQPLTQRSTRHYNIYLASDGTFKHENNHSFDTCTVAIDSANKRLTITHDKPFTSSKQGTSIASVSASVLPQYIAKTQSEDRTKFHVKIVDLTTTTFIDPATLSTPFWLSLVHHGFEVD